MWFTRLLCVLGAIGLLTACGPTVRAPHDPHTAAPIEPALGTLEEAGPIAPTGLITLSKPLSEESVVLVFFSGHQCPECLNPVGRTDRIQVVNSEGTRLIVVGAETLPEPLRATCLQALSAGSLDASLTYDTTRGLWMLGPSFAIPSGCAAGVVAGATVQRPGDDGTKAEKPE